jgi:hypothetical protein
VTLMCEKLSSGCVWVCENEDEGIWRKVVHGSNARKRTKPAGFVSVGFYPVIHPQRYKVWNEDFEQREEH